MVVDLTIIIVTWNTRELTRTCLASIREADPLHNWRVVVVDNASRDGTSTMIREEYPWVHLRVNEKNIGFARANNLILREVTTQYVLFLNSDTLLSKEAVPGFLEFMASHQEVGLTGCQLVYPDGRLQNSIVFFPSLLTELTNKSLLQRIAPGRFPGKRQSFTYPLEVDSVIGAAMMGRMEALRSVDFFDEQYFLFLEETDLCFRLKQKGWRVIFLPHVKVVHLQGQSVSQVKPQARVEYQRSLIRYFEKNHGPHRASIIRRYGYLKSWIGLVGALPGRILGSGNRSSWEKYRYLLSWYQRGCPDHMGLQSE